MRDQQMEDIMKRTFIYISALLLSVAFLGISHAAPFVTLPDGLEYKDLKIGTGMQAQSGATAVIHFIGWVDKNGQRGKEIFNSRKENKPVSFVIGTENVMQGWNEGVLGMRAGGTRLLKIPPELGYGAKEVDDVVPPHAHLLFVIELLKVK